MERMLLLLVLLCALLDQAVATEDVFKYKCFAAATYGYLLNDGLILTDNTATEPDCVSLCLKYDNCISYNFEMSHEREKQCQISSKDVFTSQEQLQKNEHFLHRSLAVSTN